MQILAGSFILHSMKWDKFLITAGNSYDLDSNSTELYDPYFGMWRAQKIWDTGLITVHNTQYQHLMKLSVNFVTFKVINKNSASIWSKARCICDRRRGLRPVFSVQKMFITACSVASYGLLHWWNPLYKEYNIIKCVSIWHEQNTPLFFYWWVVYRIL